MKNVSVIVSGGAADDIRPASLLPGTTAADLTRALGLEGYMLSTEGSVHGLAAEEDLYPKVADGGKLRATPIADVGI